MKAVWIERIRVVVLLALIWWCWQIFSHRDIDPFKTKLIYEQF